MMKRRGFWGLVLCVGVWAGCSSQTPSTDALRVYAHDSFVGKHALGPVVAEEFTRACGGAKLEWVVAGDAGQLLQRLEVDRVRGQASAHALVGMDQLQWQNFAPFVEAVPGLVDPALLRAEAREAPLAEGFVPYDYGVFGWIGDTEALKKAKLPPPERWEQLTGSEWQRKLLLEDPRTSTPGFAALLTVEAVQGKNAWAFWKRLRPSWLTLAPGWDEAYGLFLKEKAPLVWSYTSSEAYHRQEGSTRYRALLLDGVGIAQIEGAGLIRGAMKTEAERSRAVCFLRVLGSPAVQNAVPTHQWMYPVLKQVALPESFRSLPPAKKVLSPRLSREDRDKKIETWRSAF